MTNIRSTLHFITYRSAFLFQCTMVAIGLVSFFTKSKASARGERSASASPDGGLQTIEEVSKEQTEADSLSFSASNDFNLASNVGVSRQGLPVVADEIAGSSLFRQATSTADGYATSPSDDELSIQLDAVMDDDHQDHGGGEVEAATARPGSGRFYRVRGASGGSSMGSLPLRPSATERLNGSYTSLNDSVQWAKGVIGNNMNGMHASFTRMHESMNSIDGATSQASRGSRFSAVSGLNPRQGVSAVAPVDSPEKGISSTISTLIVINYLSGGLLLPGGFAAGGILLTSIIFAAVCIQCYITSAYILEACARADALDEVRDSVHLEVQYKTEVDAIHVKRRKYEISVLNKLFLGKRWSHFFTFCAACDLYGITWSYAAIFASTLANEEFLPWGFDYQYTFYIGMFVVLALPLSCSSLLDQVPVQMIFLSTRMVMAVLMVITLLVAFANPEKAYFGDQVGPNPNVPLVHWSGAIEAIQKAVFTTACQFCVPAIGAVTRNKKAVGSILQYAIAFIFLLNMVLAVLVSMYFGSATNASNNLNWLDYGVNQAPWVHGVGQFIVIFAAVDGIAVYPLIAVSLGDILMGEFYGEKVFEAEQSFAKRLAFRLMASVPQALGALFVPDLNTIATYAGVFTLISYTANPALLQIRSICAMQSKGLVKSTNYSHFLLVPSVAYVILGAVAAIIVGVIFTGIHGAVANE